MRVFSLINIILSMMPAVLSSINGKTLTVDVLTDNEIEATFIEENSNISIKL